MRDRGKIVTAGLVFLFSLWIRNAPAYADITVTAKVEPKQATLEDEIILTVTVRGTRQSTDPSLPSMPAFSVVSTGTTTSFQIINGDMDYKKEYTFVLIAHNEGTQTIGPISVFSDGREYRTELLNVVVGKIPAEPHSGGGVPKVAPPDSSSDPTLAEKPYWIETHLSRLDPYLNEQILFTFRFYTRVNVGNATLNLPDFADFVAEEVVPEKKYYQEFGGERYVVNEKVMALFPLRSGELTIGETTLHVEVPDPSKRDPFDDPFFGLGRMRLKPVNLRARSLTLAVKPLPEPVPDDFTRLVGNFAFVASLSATQIKAGEQATLTLEISGEGKVNDATLPQSLTFDDFKVYDDKPEVTTVKKENGLEGKKIFKKSLVPLREGSWEIPSISLSYFDPAEGVYKKMESPPLTLTVEGAPPETTSTALPGKERLKTRAHAEDIATIHENLGEADDASLLWINVVLLIVPPIVFLTAFSFWWRRKKWIENPEKIKSRECYGVFVRHMRALKKRKAGKNPMNTEGILVALRLFLGNRFASYGHSLTAHDVLPLLEKGGVSGSLALDLKKMMAGLEETQYGTEGKDFSQDKIEQLEKTIREINRKARV